MEAAHPKKRRRSTTGGLGADVPQPSMKRAASEGGAPAEGDGDDKSFMLKYRHKALQTQMFRFKATIKTLERELRRKTRQLDSSEGALAALHHMFTQLQAQVATASAGVLKGSPEATAAVSAAHKALTAASHDVPGVDASPMAQLLVAGWSSGGKTQGVPDAASSQLQTVLSAIAAVLAACKAGSAGWDGAAAAAVAPAASKVTAAQQGAAALRTTLSGLQGELAAAREAARSATRDLQRARVEGPGGQAGPPTPAPAAPTPAAVATGAGAETGATSERVSELQDALGEAKEEAESFKRAWASSKEVVDRKVDTIRALQAKLRERQSEPSVGEVETHPQYLAAVRRAEGMTKARDMLTAELAAQQQAVKQMRGAVAHAQAAVPTAVDAVRREMEEKVRALGGQLAAAQAAVTESRRREVVAAAQGGRVAELQGTVQQQAATLALQRKSMGVWKAEWAGRAGLQSAAVKDHVAALEARVGKLAALLQEREGAIEALKTADRAAMVAAVVAAAGEGDGPAAKLAADLTAVEAKLAAARAEAASHRAEREKVTAAYTAKQAEAASAAEEQAGTLEAVDELSEAIEGYEEEAAKNLQALQNKDDVLGSLSDKIAEANSKVVGAHRDTQAAVAALEAVKEGREAEGQAVQALQQQVAMLTEAASKAASEVDTVRYQSVAKWAAEAAQGRTRSQAEAALEAARDKALADYEYLSQLAKESDDKNVDMEQAYEASKQDLAATQKKLKALQDASAAGEDGEPLSKAQARELKTYKKWLMCPVAKTKVKDVVLRKCGHGMCKDVAEQRLKNRMRRCPMCNLGFSAEDVIPVHLDL